jgi:negative regulator of sigma-B (phosphoserine phosphatase)
MARDGSSVIEWGSAGVAFGGGNASGDLHVVAPFNCGALVAVIDGLGHGDEAAGAARTAAQLLEEHAGEPVSNLIMRCHEALRPTRGAVMSLAAFDTRHSSMSWIAVGNVEAVLMRRNSAAAGRREVIAMRGGIVGYNLPPLRAATLPIARGDILIMATDGIRSGFTDELDLKASAQEITDAILARYAKGSDDAHVVTARYLGATRD